MIDDLATGEILLIAERMEKYASILREIVLNPGVTQEDISYIGITVRTHNVLKENGFYYVRDLLKATEVDLLKLPGFGHKSLSDIVKNLERYGLSLKKP
jgi:DNA-directed RNA polymerase alpha subunit